MDSCTYVCKGTPTSINKIPFHALGKHIEQNTGSTDAIEGYMEEGKARRCGDDLKALKDENEKRKTTQNGLDMHQ